MGDTGDGGERGGMSEWRDPYGGECRYDDVNHCPDCGEAYDWHEGPTRRRIDAARGEVIMAARHLANGPGDGWARLHAALREFDAAIESLTVVDS